MDQDVRSIVISNAVEIEETMSVFLADHLKISIDDESKRLPLDYIAFEQKSHLLKDMGAISASQYLLLKIFGSIRNKFAHNIRVRVLSDCISQKSDHFKHLTEFFHMMPISDDYEEYLTTLYDELVVGLCLMDLLGRMEYQKLKKKS